MAKAQQHPQRKPSPKDAPPAARDAAPTGPPKWYDVPPPKCRAMLAVSTVLLAAWLAWLAWLTFTVLNG